MQPQRAQDYLWEHCAGCGHYAPKTWVDNSCGAYLISWPLWGHTDSRGMLLPCPARAKAEKREQQ